MINYVIIDSEHYTIPDKYKFVAMPLDRLVGVLAKLFDTPTIFISPSHISMMTELQEWATLALPENVWLELNEGGGK